MLRARLVGGKGAARGRGGSVVDAVAWVEDEVRERVRRGGVDPQAEPSAVRELVQSVVDDYGDRSVPSMADVRHGCPQTRQGA